MFQISVAEKRGKNRSNEVTCVLDLVPNWLRKNSISVSHTTVSMTAEIKTFDHTKIASIVLFSLVGQLQVNYHPTLP